MTVSKGPLGKVIWITGLSGAGKTSLARELTDRLRSIGHAVILLDGDELREIFGASALNAQNHGHGGRLALATKYSYLCHLISRNGITVVIATISLFREIHTLNRSLLPDYFEIYLRVPLEELRRRDPKGIYRRFDAGEISSVAGLDLKVDCPENADWIVDFEPDRSVGQLTDICLTKLNLGL